MQHKLDNILGMLYMLASDVKRYKEQGGRDLHTILDWINGIIEDVQQLQVEQGMMEVED